MSGTLCVPYIRKIYVGFSLLDYNKQLGVGLGEITLGAFLWENPKTDL